MSDLKLPPLEWVVDEIVNALEIENDAAESRITSILTPYFAALRESAADKQRIAELTKECAELKQYAPRWIEQNNGRTHWEGCWQDHCDCALKRIAELEKELAKHIEDNDWFTDLFSRIHDILKEAGEPITEPLPEGKHSQWRTLETRIYHLAARAERAESQLGRLRNPKVYTGMHYATVEVPERCPDCDGRDFISHGTAGMVCKSCWLTAELERAESQLAIARDLIESMKREEPACESDFCHHSGLAHCNLGRDGRRGCCYCLCENYVPAPPESMRKEKQA